MSSIVPTSSGSVAIATEPVLGLEDFYFEGPPPVARITLIQSSSQQIELPNSKLGEFYDTLTQQSIALPAALQVVRASFSRVMFPPKGSDNTDVLCRSRDSRTPAPEFTLVRAQEMGLPTDKVSCQMCPHSQWVKGEDGKNHVECRKNLEMIVRIADGTPRLLSIHGMSFGPAFKYVGAFAQRRVPPAHYMTIFETQTEKGAQSSYFVLKLRQGDAASPEAIAEAADFNRRYAAGWMDAASDLDEGGAPPVPVGTGPAIDTTATVVPETDLF